MNSFAKFLLLIYFACLAIFGSNNGYSQDTGSIAGFPKNIFKTAPFKFIGILNPEVTLSYERRLDDRYGMQVTAGVMAPTPGFDFDVDNMYYRGLKFAFEPRYYLSRGKANSFYLSAESDYRQKKYYINQEFTGVDEFGQWVNMNDTVNVDKLIMNFSFKVGYQVTKNGFAIDMYTGLGLRFKNVAHSNIDPRNTGNFFENGNPFAFDTMIGPSTTIHFPLNIRIGYAF